MNNCRERGRHSARPWVPGAIGWLKGFSPGNEDGLFGRPPPAGDHRPPDRLVTEEALDAGDAPLEATARGGRATEHPELSPAVGYDLTRRETDEVYAGARGVGGSRGPR